MPETPDIRLKRLHMRSIRRGIKEMDIILGRYSEVRLAQLGPDTLTLYEALLSENDHDLYQWVSGQVPPPEQYSDLIRDVTQHACS